MNGQNADETMTSGEDSRAFLPINLTNLEQKRANFNEINSL